MSPARLAAPRIRIAGFYTTLFMAQGVTTAFAGIWFKGLGLSDFQVGVMNAAPVLVMLSLNLWLGRIADRADDWRRVIVAGALVAGIAPLGLGLAQGFAALLVVWTLGTVAQMSMVPVVDAATMRLSRGAGFDFSSIRAWGTVGYLCVILATGVLVGHFGPTAFLPVLCAVALLRAAASLTLPRFRAPGTRALAPQGATRLLQVMRPWFVLPLVGWAMIFASHLILNAFQGLLWKQQGLTEQTIGALIALGAVAETAMFFLFRHLARFPARWLILVSALVTVFRWTAFSFQPGVALLIPLQVLHAVTYALGFLACTTFIARWTADDIAAEAQAFFVLLQQGFAVVALLGFGWLVGIWGAQAYLASAAFAALGAGLVWLSLRLRAPQSADTAAGA